MQNNHFLYELFAYKAISSKRFFELKQQEDVKEERPFFYYLFLSLGVSLFLVGLTFFIAANWASIPKVLKLLGLQGFLLFFVILAFYFKAKILWFHLFVFSASILVGITLAAIGQIYQTGADSYLLFSLWTLLIAPWALFLQLPHLFSFWLALLYLSILLFWDQYLQAFDLLSFDHFALALICLSSVMLLISLFGTKLKLFSTAFNRYVLLILALICVMVPVVDEIFSTNNKGDYFYLIFLLQLLILGRFYYVQKALACLALVLLNLLVFIEIILFKGLIHDLSSLLIFSAISIILAVVFGNGIKQLHLHFSKVTHA